MICAVQEQNIIIIIEREGEGKEGEGEKRESKERVGRERE